MHKIPLDFKKYAIIKIDSGASKKNFYRLKKEKKSYILTDFSFDKKEYYKHLNVYNILKDVDISIPKIITKNEKDLTIISQDFGDLRYDKIIKKESVKSWINLLQYAIDTLIVINKSITFNRKFNLKDYSFDDFKREIIELPKYYFPYANICSNQNLTEEFLHIWTESYKNLNFNFYSFVHKDFNINNLILLPYQKHYLKCGIIDYQSAFWGENCWDLFSLLEDSRIFFTDEFNEEFIDYLYNKTNQNITLEEYKLKYHFLNCSRQSRLIGRWVKLSKDLNKKWYLDFIPVTKKRLQKSLNYLKNDNLNNFYNKYIFNYEF